jgi:hypothetical protein
MAVMTLQEYAAVRQDPAMFFNVPGRYLVVRKRLERTADLTA